MQVKYRRAIYSDIPSIKDLVSRNLMKNVKDRSKGYVYSDYDINNLDITRVMENEHGSILAVCIVEPINRGNFTDYGVELNTKGKYVFSVCVEEAYRLNGIAKRMYKGIQEEFRGYSLYVTIAIGEKANDVSLKFHAKLQFKNIGACTWSGTDYGMFELSTELEEGKNE